MTSTVIPVPPAKVDDVLITAELANRPARAKDHERESHALGLLAQEMATNPAGVLQKCAELAMELCHAESAGISILEPQGATDELRWHAAAGAFAPHLHGTMPTEASRCGTVIERDCVLLFKEAERFFPALRSVEPRIYENLLAPWHVKGKAAGTLWAVKHTPEGRFDAEDARVLQSLARFSAAAYQMISALDEAAAERSSLGESEERFRSLFEEMDEGFALCELVRDAVGRAVDFRYVEVNPAVVRHAGIKPETLRGRLAKEVFPNRSAWYVETYARVVESGQSVVEEHYFSHVDRWLRINAFPRGGDRFAVLYSDISERKRTDAELQASEERQAFLLRFTDAVRSERTEAALIARAVQMLADELRVDRAYATRHNPAADLTNVVYEVRAPGLTPLPTTLRFSDFPEAGRQTFERTLVFEDTARDAVLTDADKVALASMGVGALLSRPLRRDGNPLFALGVVSTLPRGWTHAEIALVEDVTERTWEAAERLRGETALRDSEERQRALIEGVPQLVWRASRTGQWTWASPQWTQFTGQSEKDSRGWGWLECIHRDDRDAARAAWSQALNQGRFEADYRIAAHQPGHYRWFQTRATPIRDGAGGIIEWLGTSTDVDDLRSLQERQQVLVAELQHRTRNIMGVVRSMADKTARTSVDLSDFRHRFRDRLQALSRVQGLLSRLNEHDRVTFDELVETELAAMGNGGNRVRLEGPKGVRLRSSMVQTLAMALHELATNAVKYGALGQADGRLSVTWRLVSDEDAGGPRLHVDWRESGVAMPPFGSRPSGSGQGRELIEKALPYQLGAQTRYVLGPDGVHCTISIPVSAAPAEGV